MRKLTYILILAILAIGCQKDKTVQCTRSVVYLNPDIALSGYDSSVVDSMYQYLYARGTDSLVYSWQIEKQSLTMWDDILYLRTKQGNGMGGCINANYDHLITIGQDSFKITDIVPCPNIYTYYAKGECTIYKGTAFGSFDKLHLNGQIVTEAKGLGEPITYLLLSKP